MISHLGKPHIAIINVGYSFEIAIHYLLSYQSSFATFNQADDRDSVKIEIDFYICKVSEDKNMNQDYTDIRT